MEVNLYFEVCRSHLDIKMSSLLAAPNKFVLAYRMDGTRTFVSEDVFIFEPCGVRLFAIALYEMSGNTYDIYSNEFSYVKI